MVEQRCRSRTLQQRIRGNGERHGTHRRRFTGWQPDYRFISLGVIAKFFPLEKIREILEQTQRASVRERDLPAHVVGYYVIALALYMRCSYREVLRCLLEGVQWLRHPSAQIKVAGKSGISQARSRLGVEPVKQLYAAVVAPIAEQRTCGAWYRQWRLVSLDGSTLNEQLSLTPITGFGCINVL
jgi:hypothetical protein